MKVGKVREILERIFLEIIPFSNRALLEGFSPKIEELSEKLSETFSSEAEINSYIEFMIEYIDNLNEFFARNKKGKVPYSNLFSMAMKDERISSFFFEKGIRKKQEAKKPKEIGMAGMRKKESLEQGSSEISLHIKKVLYGCIFIKGEDSFLFSAKTRKVYVQTKRKVISYSEYRKKKKEKNEEAVYLKEIYEDLRKIEKDSLGESSAAFMIFFRQIRAKARGRAFLSEKKKKGEKNASS